MKRVLVTGASSGIGAASVRALAKDGWEVIATARREDRLEALAAETGARYVAADLTTDAGVAAIFDYCAKLRGVNALVNNAGGAIGTEAVADGGLADWRAMYELNVLGTLAVTQRFLAQLGPAGGDAVFITSTAAHESYPGGAGYTAAKHAEREIVSTLRLELVGEPVRLIEIAPGLVHTEEFSLVRFRGDQAKADAVYAGVDAPLVADDIAEAVRWTLSLPSHVNIDSLVIRPREQANSVLKKRMRADAGA
ncbi:NADP-dependent 3-hydroxy acid dehydrogenase YdfG [Arcanobacterium wilhelmae]|uniref:NADP-dependent 3-hydroxy acid dehydrogenase YdfG n=1 Tax=Arcanobacterium wilhelmae TaxID=1803177 RepID=A0ABT9N9G2_9ACTO|nr:SDR family NAD(P)-dependent oxidoreductase [Arcanobacterium wilhelmae]MDP9800347.1 NADP-dependent 3-hydroxy acid dehydrogenase YdfG [Arcanobacterium wilhelmae]WFN89783.1 SDR family NAD(P)-dependent oxidoreductase [Arcanobacterium wilhelmae]